MMRKVTIALIASLMWGSAALAQSSWPASKVDFTDAEDLQQKFDAGDLGGSNIRFESPCGTGGDGVSGEFCYDGSPPMLVCEPGNAPCGVGQWTDVASSGLTNPLTSDLLIGLNEIEQQPAIGYNSTLTGWDTGQEMSALWRRYAESGPLAVCESGAPNQFEACQALAVNSAECGGAHDCVRNDGTGGTPGMSDVPITITLDSIGPGTYSQDPILGIRYNAGTEGNDSAPQVAGLGQILWNYEFDWRSPTNKQRHEHYLQIVKAGGAAIDSWRPFFFGANLDDEVSTYGHSTGLWRAGSEGTEHKIGQMKLGDFDASAPKPGLRLSLDESVPSGTFQLEMNGSVGGAPLGSWHENATTSHFTEGVTSVWHATSTKPSIRQGAIRSTIAADGANRFGACDANSTGAGVSEGDQCVTNGDCNDGAAYSGSNGICVHGDGAVSSGTNDGLCVNTTTHSLGATVFCDSTLGTQGTCSAGEICTDIQDWWIHRTDTLVSDRAEAFLSDAVQGSLNTFGYCSSTSGGAPEHEGMICAEDADCAGTCIKEDGGVYTNALVARETITNVDQSRTNGYANNPLQATTKEVNIVLGEDNQFNATGTNQDLNAAVRLRFKSPNTTGFTGTIFNDYVIRIENQWGGSSGSGASYNPVLIGWDAQTAQNTGIFHAVRAASAGWDTGNWRLGDVYVWSAGEGTSAQTNDGLRVELGSPPTSSGDGFALLRSSNSDGWGPTLWGDVGDASFDTGDEVCAVQNLTCVQSLEFDGSEIACGTTPTGTTSGYFHVLCK